MCLFVQVAGGRRDERSYSSETLANLLNEAGRETGRQIYEQIERQLSQLANQPC